MARNINDRLTRLKARRRGTDRLNRVALDVRQDLLIKSLTEETWQKRGSSNQPNTRYALGSMQEVGPDYTRVSVETAERVGNQLHDGLASQGFDVEFRLQGSVPANLHIHGVSDVDLLNLETSILTFAKTGIRAVMGYYKPSAPRTTIGVLLDMRAAAERILKAKYPAATVDCTGGKAINISGGSLARAVDVVPSVWWDTQAYQSSLAEHDRGVSILDKKVPTTIENLPFLHIKRINERDVTTAGGLKKSIRLCKNVKSDAEDEGTSIDLPSFDIAAIMYHADASSLRKGALYELAILAETQRHLDYLTTHEEEAKKLYVPDGSRRIFDTTAKLIGLRRLSIEIDDLMTAVAKEQDRRLATLSVPAWADSRAVLSETYIPVL